MGSMRTRRLGTQGLEVSALGLGTMGMSGVAGMPLMYGEPDEAEGIATIRRALDLGVNFFDTAEVYGPYTNEILLGKALAGRRHEAVIATKFGFTFSIDNKIAGLDGRPENVHKALDGCLQRLGTDYIDLWYQHRRDRNVPIEETVGAMAEQVKAGKVRFLGLSEMGVETIRRAHAVHPISAVQSEYSLWTRNPEIAVLQACRDIGAAFVAFSPTARAFLTGKLRDVTTLDAKDIRRSMPRFQAPHWAANQALLPRFAQLAADLGLTPAQLALAWVLHQAPHVVAIPGTTSEAHVRDNFAAGAVRLDGATLQALGALINPQTVSGERYDAQATSEVDTER